MVRETFWSDERRFGNWATSRDRNAGIFELSACGCCRVVPLLGYVAFWRVTEREAAEAARLDSEVRQDWAAAANSEEDRDAATKALVHAIGVGFLLPLGLLLAHELYTGRRRARRRD